jgi:hypothetical protein
MQNGTSGIPDGFSNCQNKFGILNFGHCDLPFDLAQGGELVEPFDIWHL